MIRYAFETHVKGRRLLLSFTKDKPWHCEAVCKALRMQPSEKGAAQTPRQKFDSEGSDSTVRCIVTCLTGFWMSDEDKEHK